MGNPNYLKDLMEGKVPAEQVGVKVSGTGPGGLFEVYHPQTELTPEEETAFRVWYDQWAQTAGISRDPDDPRQKYDYRGAWKAGIEPQAASDGLYHWDSRFKHPDHPNRFVDGVDTMTGEPVAAQPEAAQAEDPGFMQRYMDALFGRVNQMGMVQTWKEGNLPEVAKELVTGPVRALYGQYTEALPESRTLSEYILNLFPFVGPSANEAIKETAGGEPEKAIATITTDILPMIAPELLAKAYGSATKAALGVTPEIEGAIGRAAPYVKAGLTPDEGFARVRDLDRNKLGTVVEPQQLTRGWIEPDGTMRELSGSHETSIAAATGTTPQAAVKNYPKLAGEHGLVRYVVHRGKAGTRLVAEVFGKPTEEQFDAIRRLDEVHRKDPYFDELYYAYTSPETSQPIIQGKGIANLRRDLERVPTGSWKELQRAIRGVEKARKGKKPYEVVDPDTGKPMELNALPAKLPSAQRLAEAWQRGEQAKNWYADTQREAVRLFGNEADANLFMDLLAATSLNTAVEPNMTLAFKAFARIKSEVPIAGGGELIPGYSQKGFMPAILEGINAAIRGEEIPGPKANPFSRALKGDPNAIVIDVWMMRAFGFMGDRPTDVQRAFIKERVLEISRATGDTPREVQARIWQSAKDGWEMGKWLTGEKHGQPIKKGRSSFAEILKGKEIYRISYELAHPEGAPAESLFPSAYDERVPFEQRQAITREVTSAIVDDALQNYPDIYTTKHTAGPGGYEDYPLAVSGTIEVAGPRASVEALINELGYRLEQEKVVAHRMRMTDQVNGFMIGHEALGNREVLHRFWSELRKRVPEFSGFAPDKAGGMPAMTTVDFTGIHFSPEQVGNIKGRIDEAAKAAGIEKVYVSTFDAETLQAYNNWKEYPNGEHHRLGANKAGSPVVERRLDNSHRGLDRRLEEEAWQRNGEEARRVWEEHRARNPYTPPEPKVRKKPGAEGEVRETESGYATAAENEQLNLFAQQELDRISGTTGVSSVGGNLATEGGVDVGQGVRLHGLGIDPTKAMQGNFWAAVQGTRARTPTEVAQAAQVFRNPSFETLHYLYIRRGRVVAHEAVSSRMPGFAKIFKDKEVERHWHNLRSKIVRLGADTVYMVHNHPSGRVAMSADDKALTYRHMTNIPQVKGHIVINHKTFSLMRKAKGQERLNGPTVVEEHPLDTGGKYGPWFGKDELLNPSVPSDVLSIYIRDPTVAARVAAHLQIPANKVTLLYRSSQGTLRAVESVPRNLFLREKEFADWLVGRTRTYGARNVVAYYGPEDAAVLDASRKHIQNNTLLDAIMGEESQMQKVQTGPGKLFGRPNEEIIKTYKVREPVNMNSEYRKEQDR